MSGHPAPGSGTRVETAFGAFDVAADQIVTFPAGLPGFEECRRFVVLSSRELEPFKCLQSVEGPSASFLAAYATPNPDSRIPSPESRCPSPNSRAPVPSPVPEPRPLPVAGCRLPVAGCDRYPALRTTCS